MDTMLRYYASKTNDHVLIGAAAGRCLKRSASGDKRILGATRLRELVRDPNRRLPALVLLKQDGGHELEWKAGPFWWPLIASPGRSLPCVYASKVAV